MKIDHVDELLRRIGAEPVEVPGGLAARACERLAPELLGLKSRRHRVLCRLAIAGALSFPLLVAANAALAWLLFAALERFLPSALAGGLTAFVGAVMLLSLSLSYGSLPILASLGLHLREETS